MKRVLIVLLLCSVTLFSQEPIKFEKVIKTDSIGKTMLYNTINDWFASTYNSSKEVIQMSDKDAGIIIGNGSMSYGKKGMSYLCYNGSIKYTVKVYIKDNRYKVVLTNFNHSVDVGNADKCALGIVTTAEFYQTKGMIKKYHNKVWDDIKAVVEIYSEGIFASLENKTKNIKSENNDDW